MASIASSASSALPGASLASPVPPVPSAPLAARSAAAAGSGSSAAAPATPTGVPSAPPAVAAADRGLALAVLAVVLFALTTPMTRLAVGADGASGLSPLFVTAGRAAAAGGLAAAYLLAVRARRPSRRDAPALAVCALGTVLGFPLFLALALRRVDAVHAAVVTGVIPIATAAVAALVFRQRPSAGFWASAVAGTGLVLGYAAWRGAGGLGAADLLLLGAVASAAVGYVAGAALSSRMPPSHAVSWVLVLSLPATVPAALAAWPAQPVGAAAWAGFAYVSLVSMWLAFFAWYAALARGGPVATSQVQLVQPFLSMLFAVPLLGETIDAATIAVALAVAATVLVGRRLAAGRRP